MERETGSKYKSPSFIILRRSQTVTGVVRGLHARQILRLVPQARPAEHEDLHCPATWARRDHGRRLPPLLLQLRLLLRSGPAVPGHDVLHVGPVQGILQRVLLPVLHGRGRG